MTDNWWEDRVVHPPTLSRTHLDDTNNIYVCRCIIFALNFQIVIPLYGIGHGWAKVGEMFLSCFALQLDSKSKLLYH